MATFAYDWPAAAPPDCRGGVLSIGNFDGVHRGHAELIDRARQLARDLGRPSVALTFDPHPLFLLRPGVVLSVLTTSAERVELLQERGIDHVLVVRTSPGLLALDATTFFRDVMQQRFAARGLVEGSNFCFGRDRSGDIALLADLCAKAAIRLDIVPPQLHSGEPISSSRIRQALQAGDVTAAAALLGRPYRLRGTVVAGQRRGRTLGFPTANLGQVQTVIPAEGVYAVRALHKETVWAGAANIGPNPTFGESVPKIEIHLIGFNGDLYDAPLAVDFLERIRATRAFASVAELKAQLEHDVERARSLAKGWLE